MTMLKPPKHPKHDVQPLIDLHAEGLSPYQISKRTGIPRSTIDYYVRSSGKSRSRIKSPTVTDADGNILKFCVAGKHYKFATTDYFAPKKGAHAGLTSICRECRHLSDAERWSRTKETDLKRGKRWREALKRAIIGHYSQGTYACACCAESCMEFLVIDHIAGNGNQHRKAIGRPSGLGFYRWLQSNNFPDGFRVLCHNCNASLGSYGYCPHQGKIPDTRQVA